MTEFGNLIGPLAQSELYPQFLILEASPKAISRRTSYLRVRLAFHRYPQLIPRFFNIGGFGPPLSFTQALPWPWIDHPVSGLHPVTKRPVQTRFRYGFGTLSLNLATEHNSPARSARSTRSHFVNARHCQIVLPLLVSLRFQVLFHSPPGVLFTFPSRYCSAIGCQLVFSLRRWSSLIHTGFHVPRTTWDYLRQDHLISATGLLPSVAQLSSSFRLLNGFVTCQPICRSAEKISLYPAAATPAGFNTAVVWAVPLSLAATERITVVFSSFGY